MLYHEAKEIRIDQLARKGNLTDNIYIAFDLESTGIHKYTGNQRSLEITLDYRMRQQMIDGYADEIKKKNPDITKKDLNAQAYKKYKELMSKKPVVQIAEVAAIVFNADGKILGKFHQYVKFDKNLCSPNILKLISRNKTKEAKAKEPSVVLSSFSNFLSRFPDAILIAHNYPYDGSLLVNTAKALKINSLVSKMKNVRFIDTRKQNKIRDYFKGLFAQAKYTNKKGDTFEDNSLAATVKALYLTNAKAHTAIEDTKVLMKAFLKLLSLAEVIAKPNKFITIKKDQKDEGTM